MAFPATDAQLVQNRNQLFAMMSKFISDTLCGWVAGIYRVMGPLMRNYEFPSLAKQPMLSYFNEVARSLYSRADEYINSVFDPMVNLDVGNKYHRYDLLQIIFQLTVSVLNVVPWKDCIHDSREGTLEHAREVVDAILREYRSIIPALKGCSVDHREEHMPDGKPLFHME